MAAILKTTTQSQDCAKSPTNDRKGEDKDKGTEEHEGSDDDNDDGDEDDENANRHTSKADNQPHAADGALAEQTNSEPSQPVRETTPQVRWVDPPDVTTWKWTGIDIGPWSPVVDQIRSSLSSQWNLSPRTLSIDFHQLDMLESDSTSSRGFHVFHDQSSSSHPTPIPSLSTIMKDDPPQLVTLLFTLTELLTQSRPSTIALLRQLTSLTKPGCLFLVVDSASDISDFELGTGEDDGLYIWS